MKKIFISSFHPLVSRNILQTNILFSLSREREVYILCPSYKTDYFEKSFASKNVHIVSIDIEKVSKLESFWKKIGNALLRTTTIINNRRERYILEKDKLSYIFFLFIYHFIARFRLFKYFYQKFSPFVFSKDTYHSLFDRYKPDYVFSTDIFNEEDVRMIASAKRHKIRFIGMVRSWDNCTNKGIIPIIPESIIVHNYVIKDELEKIHSLSEKVSVIVTGIPQFDYYLNYKPADNDFFKRHNFVEDRKIILFAPTGKKFVNDDWFLLQILHDSIKSGAIKGNPQLLVRLPPGDTIDFDKVNLSSDVSVFIDNPGISFSSNILKDKELTYSDMFKLADTLYFSDVLISVGSTLCIDIAVFNKPIICPNIKLEKLDEHCSMVKMYKKYHFRYLIRTNACYIPETKESFIDYVNICLENPNHKSKERQVLINEQVFKFDGNASKRISDFLLSI